MSEYAPINPNAASQVSMLKARDLAVEAWACRFENRARSRQLALQTLELIQLETDADANSETVISVQVVRGLALRALAFCDYMESDYEAAVKGFTAALEIATQNKEPILERDCLNLLGAVHQRLGDMSAAIEYTRRVFEANVALQDEPAIVYSLNNFAMLHLYIGEPHEAVRLYEDALERANRIAEPTRQVTVISNLGEALTQLGRAAEAVTLLEQGLKLAEEHALDMLLAPTLSNLAEALTQLGELERAFEYYQQALSTVREYGPPEGEVHCQLGLARINLRRDQIVDAIHNAQAALEVAERLQLQQTSSEAHELLSRIYAADGAWREAFKHLKSHHALEQQRRADVAEQRLQAVNAQFEVRRARSDAEIERLRNTELAQALAALEQLNADKTALLEQLGRASRQLEDLAFRDPLTGLANRRQLETVLEREFAEARLSKRALAVALMDIDDFKLINDRFSHAVGDEVLVMVANLIRQESRGGDLASRYGGEEFVVILSQTSQAQAFEILERLRLAVANADWSGIAAGLRVTLSIGLCTNASADTPREILATADENMYESKRLGKNRTSI